MSVSERQYQGILRVVECLCSSLDSREVRELAGGELLKLLRADYFASFTWSPDRHCFGDPVFINMDPGNLERYRQYYQFHNPISAKAQRFRRAIRVNEIVPQRELIQTEFFNDFLLADGLYYGVNLYVHEGDANLGDMRIWRSARRENFDDSDLQVLEIIKPHFCNAMRNTLRMGAAEHPKLSGGVERMEPGLSIEWLRSVRGLTVRESQIALEIVQGRTDQEIATSMGVAFSTVRTHIRRVYEKLGVHNRTSLAHLIRASS